MMNQQVEELTQKLLSSLPENQSKIFVSKLQQYSFPGILVQEIESIVSEKLTDSLEKPESVWAGPGGEKTEEKWLEFIKAMKANLQFPASETEAIINRSVEHLLNLSVKPLSAIPEIIFEEDSDLNINQLRERKNRLPIHSHLLTAMIRYMEKKEIESISKENSGNVLKKIDKKLTENFTALHWAHYLRPLFELAGPQVDTDLIRQFYEDRGEFHLAGKFAETGTTIDENNFVVALSSSDATAVIELEEDQPSLFTPGKKDEPKSAVESDSGIVKDAEKNETVEPETTEDSTEPEVEPWSDEPAEDEEDFAIIEAKDANEAEDFIEKLKTEEIEKEEEIEDGSDEDESENEDEIDKRAEAEDNDLAAITLDDNEPEPKPDPDKLSISEEYSFRGTNLSDEDDDSETPLHSRFVFDEDYFDDEDDNESEETPSTIYDEMDLVREDDLDEKKSVLSLFEVKDSEIDEDETENESLESSFSFQADEPDEHDDESAEEDEEVFEGVYAHETDAKEPEEKVDEDDSDDKDIMSRYFSDKSDMEPAEIEEEEDDNDDSDDVPMWKSFLERDDFDEEGSNDEPELENRRGKEAEIEESAESDSDIEDGFIDEPIIDLTKDEEDIEEKIETVEEWLSDDRTRFVDSIFSGSDMAYETALSEIVDFDNWKKASQYIEKEIFSRNLVDIYNEDAVDFTDRLHNYFNEFKS